MPFNTRIFANFATVAFVLLASQGAHAEDFGGFWIEVGASGISQQSKSTVTYDFIDKYAGSVTGLGFDTTGSYEQKAKGTSADPSVELLYSLTLGRLLLGASVFVSQPKTTLTMDAYRFPSPTNQNDAPSGFQMTTEVSSALDAGVSIQPGVLLTDHIAIFGRASYHQMTADVYTATTVTGGLSYPVYTESISQPTFRGLGVGGGARIHIAEGVFVELSYERVSFQAVKAAASSVASAPDEVTVTQSQEITLGWDTARLAIGAAF